MSTKAENNTYIHPTAIVETAEDNIGAGTRIWAFTHILSRALIGKDCNICDHVFVENDVKIGDRVTIKSGVQLWDGVRLENDVFIGPNVTFTNDLFPRSKKYPEKFLQTIVKQGASIGANATILPGLTIGKNAMVGAGSVVIRTIPPNAKVVGNPARIVGYIDTKEIVSEVSSKKPLSTKSNVTGVKLLNIKQVEDMRGGLSAIEWEKQLPFIPKRAFFVYDVQNESIRGEHAHKTCHEFLVCIKGSVSVIVDDSHYSEEYLLDKSSIGLYFPPKTWTVQYKYSSDAILFVLASHEYHADDYIRDYDQFLDFVKL